MIDKSSITYNFLLFKEIIKMTYFYIHESDLLSCKYCLDLWGSNSSYAIRRDPIVNKSRRQSESYRVC